MKYVLSDRDENWLNNESWFTESLQDAKLFETEIGANRAKTKHERKFDRDCLHVVEVDVIIQVRGAHQ